MSSPWQQPDAPSLCAPRAAGHGEVWRDWDADATFRQYGWRRGTGEDAYSPATLVGNWAEERRDTRALARRRPLPSQFAHYFETTYSSTYDRGRQPPPRDPGTKREPRCFPGHQPELDPLHTKPVPDSCYRHDFRDPAPHLQAQRGTQAGQQSNSSQSSTCWGSARPLS
ncbi:cilia- and flagella-associated protein 68 isoform X2 [Lepisosteus oculatus]|uniref:cilia- and flagella-associated protein 68 isoform X2 n=1 Tax=Lepisosteus oculatus TaxID=7918 RepID=UPI00371587EF